MHELQLQVSDPAELSSLHRWLARVPGVTVERVTSSPAHGEQGGWDLLTALASGGGVLAVAVRTLPEFLRSRRSSVTVTLRTKDREVTVTASNVDDVVPVIAKALDD